MVRTDLHARIAVSWEACYVGHASHCELETAPTKLIISGEKDLTIKIKST